MEKGPIRYRYGDPEVVKVIKQGLEKGLSAREIERRARADGMNFNRVWVSKYKERIKSKDEPNDYLHRNSDLETLQAFAEQEGFDVNNVSMSWIKGKVGDTGVSALVRNERTGKDLFEALDDWVDGLDLKPIELPCIEPTKKALMATITDAHVGLEPNPEGSALFEYEYDGEIYKNNMLEVLRTIQKEAEFHGAFDTLYLNDLGDNLDGRNAFTTRGGHQLDQNMGNVTAFEHYVDGKLNLIRGILEGGFSDKIVINDIVNDNHSGDFGEIANYTIEKIIKAIYGDDVIEFNRIRRFIEHFDYGEHTFMLTHGKDKKYMKSGLPLHLNDKTVNFIRQYIDHYGIKNKYLHLQKGDLHQLGYDACSAFDYRNYMAFSPASPRVQHNFGAGISGYSIDIIPESGPGVSHQDHILDYKRKQGNVTNARNS